MSVIRVFVLHLFTKFEVRRPSLSEELLISALIGLVALTFDLLTLKLVRFIAHGVGNLVLILVVSVTFRSRQYLSDGPHDLTNLTFDLGDHGASR